MPGDQDEDVTGVRKRSRTGPRHAAPKKPLLTRFQIPAGKAIALAAMPSAVLLGMGLTPRFVAQADETKGQDTFKPGPCVTASDTPSDDAKEKAKDKKKQDEKKQQKAGPTASPTPSVHASGKSGKKSGGSSSSGSGGGSSAGGGSGSSGTGGSGSSSHDPSSGGSGGGSGLGGVLDPILNPVGSVLGLGGDHQDSSAPTASATPGASASPDVKSSGDDGSKSTTSKKKSSSEKKDDSGDQDKKKDSSEKSDHKKADGKKDAKKKPKPSPSASQSTPPDTDGASPYPCPTEQHVAGKNEQAPNIVANKPWTLYATKLSLHGLKYDGVVNVPQAGGGTVQALKFRVSGIDIVDLHQTAPGPNGVTMHVRARKGSTSTISGGETTLYTEKLSGNLLGLVPITFTPDFPPPLTLPELFFTNVTVVQAGQFGGNLTVPGLHGYSTNS